MRSKVTLVLLLLNVVLFFFIFHFEHEWRTERAYQEIRRRVLGPEAANIVAFEISGGRLAAPARLEKKGDTWYLTKPLEWPANPNAVQRILNELQLLEHESSFAVADLAKHGQSLADFGFDKPQLTLTFAAGQGDSVGPAAGRTFTLRIGDSTKLGNRLYLLSPDGARIHVVNRSLVESLDLGLDQLRNDSLFSIRVFEARALNLQTPAPASLKIRLRRENSRWIFESPILARANKDAVELIINSLNGLKAGRFETKPPDEEQSGLSGAALRVALEGNGRREILLIGNPAPAGAATGTAAETDYYAKMEDKPTVFTLSIPAELLGRLRNAQEDLRERRLLDFDPRTVTSAVIAAPGLPELALQRLETGHAPLDTDPWQVIIRSNLQGPQTQAADRERIQRLLLKLYQLQADKFQSDAPSAADLENWGFNRPDREVTLTLASVAATGPVTAAPVTLKLLIGAPAGPHGVYAKLASAPFVYVVDSDILADTPVVARVYRDHLLRDLPAGAQITRLRLIDNTTQAVLFEKAPADSASPQAWETALAGEPPARKAAVLSLLESLRTLRAKTFVPPDVFRPSVEIAGETRPWKYLLETTLALTSGTGAQTTVSLLYFSERAGGTTQLVGSPEYNVVFEADQKLVDAMFALTFGPQDPGPAAPPAAPAN